MGRSGFALHQDTMKIACAGCGAKPGERCDRKPVDIVAEVNSFPLENQEEVLDRMISLGCVGARPSKRPCSIRTAQSWVLSSHPGVLSVVCPSCDAAVGKFCTFVGADVALEVQHPKRVKLARIQHGSHAR